MSFDPDAYRDKSLTTWREMADGWEERREWMTHLTGLVNQWLVDQAAPRPGQTFLELASGTGDLGLLVAERMGGDGQVISTDFAPEMVAAAQREAAARGVSVIEHRVLDAERMDLGDDSVDGVVCRWGYMLMADPAAALGETRRVLRDGGALAFAVWSTADRNPWAALPGMTLVQRGHMPPPEPGAPGIFSMGEPDRIRELVTRAGFADPQVEEITFEFRYADFADLWDTLMRLTGVVAQVLRELPPDELEATRAAVEVNLAPFRDDDGSYRTPASSWGVLTR
jgi:ubiquinone/menaquinone biosynthesis C-methylase UbiE